MIFINGYVLFAIPTWVFFAQLAGIVIIAVGAAYIVTRPQPEPHWVPDTPNWNIANQRAEQ